MGSLARHNSSKERGTARDMLPGSGLEATDCGVVTRLDGHSRPGSRRSTRPIVETFLTDNDGGSQPWLGLDLDGFPFNPGQPQSQSQAQAGQFDGHSPLQHGDSDTLPSTAPLDVRKIKYSELDVQRVMRTRQRHGEMLRELRERVDSMDKGPSQVR
uniref:adhesion G protein-coupled receptor B3-like isoform X2 n=1 Tax=Myxine glutinosa TaxID=7769 RepID=UPI00358F21C3